MPPESHWARGNAALRRKHFESAIAHYEEALSRADEPLKAHIRFNLAFALRRVECPSTTVASEVEKPHVPPLKIDEADSPSFYERLTKNDYRTIFSVRNYTKNYDLDISFEGKSAELNSIKHRIEHFNNGAIRFWITSDNHFVLDSLEVILLIDKKPVPIALILTDRPDVFARTGHPARQIETTVPLNYQDGSVHKIDIVLSKDGFYKSIFQKEFLYKSMWVSVREEAIRNGKKIILFASHNLKVQGAQTSLFQTIVGLTRDASLFPVVFSPSDGPMRKAYESHEIPVIVEAYPRINGATEIAWKNDFERFVLCIKELSPDVVVANTLQSYHSAMCGLALGIPTVLVTRESEAPRSYFSNLPNFLKPYADSLVGCVDQAVFVAQATRKLWSHADIGNQCVIYNGLAISELERKLAGVTRESARMNLGFRQDDRVVLSVGTVCERKGQLDLLEAIPHIVSRCSGTSIKFVFVGMNENEYSRKIKDIHSMLPRHLQSDVHLLPQTDDENDCLVQQLYRASDIFVMNSIHESYPRVVLEALYFGLPVVTTPCFGVLEQIEDKKSGLFYEYGNFLDLAEKVSYIIGDESQLIRYSNSAHERFKTLMSYEEMVNCYKHLIHKLIE